MYSNLLDQSVASDAARVLITEHNACSFSSCMCSNLLDQRVASDAALVLFLVVDDNASGQTALEVSQALDSTGGEAGTVGRHCRGGGHHRAALEVRQAP